ncbi:MAG: sigma-70 family RNA polymerase sigma factor [Planctomycetaceae bacterium]|nr:sigma-70 family RNA polymerase sigma factor [Planctomycetaceae bacterium]
MADNFEKSVTLWIKDLKSGSEDAAAQLWHRYFDQLVRVSSRKLGNAARRIADEEDVAVSVFNGLCQGAAAGRFDQLQNRDDLWSLLVAIAGKKAVDQVRRQTSQKRGGTGLRGESVFQNLTDDHAGFDQFLNVEPTPEFLATMEEENHRLFDLLRDETQREIARYRMEGYSNDEIAEKVGISPRSVVRKLSVIREIWSKELPELGEQPA